MLFNKSLILLYRHFIVSCDKLKVVLKAHISKRVCLFFYLLGGKLMTMMQLAKHIIAVANTKNIPITNLQLQKVLYFTFKKALQEKMLTGEKDEYDDHFLVWRYGPVAEKVYDKYSIYSGSPIIENGQFNPKFEPLNDTVTDLLSQKTSQLVKQSHEEEFWKKHEKDIEGWRSNVEYNIVDVARKN